MKTTSTYHIPVLAEEALNLLQVKKGCRYIDATLGGGGHSEQILKRGGLVLGLDHDPDAIAYATQRLSKYKERFVAVRTNFNHISQVVVNGPFSQVAGILFDLGVSSHQLETPSRGFSFNQDSKLDMRMDPRLRVAASDLLIVLTEKELYDLFTKLGEDKYAKRLASAICRTRRLNPIQTTNQLADLVIKNVPPRGRLDRTHPATRIFQALRIAVNDELNSLRETLPQVVAILEPGGRLATISFHSLEDRIVKNFIKEAVQANTLSMITPKPICPTSKEVDGNPRSRSAKLRVAEKI